MRHRKKRHRREWLLRVGVLLLVLLGAVAAIDHQLRPMVQSFATYQIKSFATEVIDAAILDYLGKEGVDYETFSTVTRDANSQVTGISLNTVNVNLFKAGITDRINSEMSQIGLQSIKIPVGSLLGTQILQGVGPDITLRVQPSSYAACSVDSQFDSAGINQTRHRVVLKMCIRDRLKQRIIDIFADSASSFFQIDTLSFGFKYGIPVEADLVFDVRFLPNPFYIPELKHQTGLDQPVYDYVFGQKETGLYVQKLFDLLDFSVPYYKNEGKSQLVIGIGCTGGKHRSVAIAETLNRHFADQGLKAKVTHRDILKDR